MTLTEILYVEDDADIQEVAQMALEAIGGFTVYLASSGPQALTILQSQTPQIILLDVMMPGMDGIETFHAIRAIKTAKKIPIVFMTAKIQKNEVDAYLALGAIGVIAKPFDPMTLADEIKQLWAFNLPAITSI